MLDVQLVGPMTGEPDFNDDAFAHAALMLRGKGYRVWSPHERSKENLEKADAIGRSLGERAAWSFWLKVAIANLTKMDAIGVLPRWDDSAGATLEMAIAFQLGLLVLTVDGKSFEEFHYEFRWSRPS